MYKIAVIGLGYVGLPLAHLFSTKYETVGFDVDLQRVNAISSGYDSTGEITPEALKKSLADKLVCTNDIEKIKNCNVYIIAVATPIDKYNRPLLTPLLEASKMVGKILSQKDIVIYESTVYPGMTEEDCVPVLEQMSGLKLNVDFFVGYSPERVNPGDKQHAVENIKKVVSGSTPETAEKIDKLYNSVLLNGTHKVSSIRVAEASKIIENIQRDVNIAFVNELAKIFNVMEIDTHEVLEAAATKWNFMKFTPGLVGGHCISVDPYYLIEKAKIYGYFPRLMSDARKLNDSMAYYVANRIIEMMNHKGILVKNAKILILGITFKENCPDIRNTQVINLCKTFETYTDSITIYDPVANPDVLKQEHDIDIFTGNTDVLKGRFDVVVAAVAHDEFKKMNVRAFLSEQGIVYDIKGFLPTEQIDGRL